MKIKYTLVLLAAALAGLPLKAFGQTRVAFEVVPYLQNSRGTPILHLSIREAEAHPGVCQYYVEGFQYLKSVRTVSLRLEKEPCFNDAYGKSRGDFFWRLPPALRKDGAQFCITVNDASTTVLVYDATNENMLVDDSTTCSALNEGEGGLR